MDPKTRTILILRFRGKLDEISGYPVNASTVKTRLYKVEGHAYTDGGTGCMKKVDALRQEYEKYRHRRIWTTPDACIDQAQKRQSRFTFYRLWKPALSAALIGYLIVLNTVPAFAGMFAVLCWAMSPVFCACGNIRKPVMLNSLSVKVPEN